MLYDQAAVDLVVVEFLLQSFIILSVGRVTLEVVILADNLKSHFLDACNQWLILWVAVVIVASRLCDHHRLACLKVFSVLDKHIRILFDNIE